MADVQEFLKDFPLLNGEIDGKHIAYLDNGATTQKPHQVIQSICGYYGGCNANPHRGAYALSVKATDIYESARKRTAQFIKAKRPAEIIFTKNATEALNLVAYSYGLQNVGAGDEIVISISEHHSNLVPWQFVAKAKGATLKYIYLEEDGNLSQEDIETKITERTKIVAVTQVSNVLGLKNDVKSIVKKAHSVGAVCVVDGSQSVAHMAVDVQDLDCDFFAFSGHKMLSPMGIGVLYGKYEILDAMEPFLRGGDMIEYVQEQESTWAELPSKFEAGTQNVGGAAGLTAAIDYLEGITFDRIEAIEKDLVDYALPQLRELPYIELYGCDSKQDNKTGIIAFNIKDVHPHDVATILDNDGVAVRAGHHCAQPLHRYLQQNASCRASFYLYNTREDIDRWIAALKKVRGVLGYGA
ncbi:MULTISPECIES: cysteine desulfurase [Selenomonas]|uniref:Cysteine desulfurase n=1 Tax=Selenomonas ruminis TaxID=2593411 RepID=A0A5D6VZ93_9FIRM|nr:MULTISPECIES: cysteine desulfurase [unclassified Selenomonas]MBQ1866751.1 cysteine desulfurase [Selenomonas sp.]TYZ19845.1 cysteine desulfurase [Selenomonas sp. mPRGC5]